MRSNFQAMVETANDKYMKLIDAVCQIRNGSNDNFDRVLNMINSIHNDEIELIIRMSDIDRENRINSQKEIQILDFMKK